MQYSEHGLMKGVILFEFTAVKDIMHEDHMRCKHRSESIR